MSNILIISQTPTHPITGGNRIRILNICEYLKQKNINYTFLFINDYDNFNTDEMQNFFGDSYIEYKKSKSRLLFFKKNLLFKIFNFFFIKTKDIIDIALDSVIKQFVKEYLKKKYNKEIDFYYPNGLDCFIQENLVKRNFSHVIVEYVAYSKALLNFNSDTKKIIDTHDVFSNRYELYLNIKSKPGFYSFYPSEEAKGLDRADIILAIQEKEKRYFEKISNKQVVEFGHFTSIQNVSFPNKNVLLFVGGQNSFNIDGINHFIDDILPYIKVDFPNINLIIAGHIVNKKKYIKESECIKFYGNFYDNVEIYSKADIVINPLRQGSGLKIKSIDALASSKPLVTYLEGVSGLPSDFDDKEFYLLSKDSQDFANNVILLLKNTTIRNELAITAKEFMISYNRKILEEFDKIIDNN